MVSQTLIAKDVWMRDLSESERHRARLVVLVGCPLKDNTINCSLISKACAFLYDQNSWLRLNRCEKELLESLRKGEYDYEKKDEQRG